MISAPLDDPARERPGETPDPPPWGALRHKAKLAKRSASPDAMSKDPRAVIRPNQAPAKPPATLPKHESGNRSARDARKWAVMQLFPALPNQPLIRD